MTEVKRFSLAKPTVQTRFHIDFAWWSKSDRDWRVYLQNLLCETHRQAFTSYDAGETVDWIDPETAEVQQVDGLQHVLISHCAKLPDFINPHTTVVDAVFRIFLANGNEPLSVTELADRLGRQPQVILKTLTGSQFYRGVRAVNE